MKLAILLTMISVVGTFGSSKYDINEMTFEIDDFIASKMYRISDETTTDQRSPYSWSLDRLNQLELPLDKVIYTQRNAFYNDTRVYVMDTGIQYEHPILQNRAVPGINLIKSENDTDYHSHGTHVASLVTGKGTGPAKVKVVSVKILNKYGIGYLSNIIRGFQWISNEVKKENQEHGHSPERSRYSCIINLSLGGSFDQKFNDITNEMSKICTVVVASGNSAADACLYSPGSAHSSVTVGSLDPDDTVSYFSNTGGCVNMYSPGRRIIGASISGKTTLKSGTSMSSPLVAGALAIKPDLDITAHMLYLKDATKAPTVVPSKEPTVVPSYIPTRMPTKWCRC